MLAPLVFLTAFSTVALGHVARQVQTTTITVLPSASFSSNGPFPVETPSIIIDNGITYSVAIVTASAQPSAPASPTASAPSGASTIVFTNPSGPGPSAPASNTGSGRPPSASVPVPSNSASGSRPLSSPSPSPSGNGAIKPGIAPLALLAAGLIALY